jgi:predicted DsbA family dithiol-disulfide isomerase
MRIDSVQIDFISDLTCPWCAIGLANLERAIGRLGAAVTVDLRLQPFELNPDLPPEGEAILDYAARKYGATRQQFDERQALIRARAEDAGLRFVPRTRIWNTFDAHRLLHWAGLEGRALPLKRALLAAYHAAGENPGARDVLLRLARAVGLDVERAYEVLAGDAHASTVRGRVRYWQSRGIQSVPSVVIDGQHLIQGGRSAQEFEQVLRDVAAGQSA